MENILPSVGKKDRLESVSTVHAILCNKDIVGYYYLIGKSSHNSEDVPAQNELGSETRE
jgi:hypothetical protein